MPFNIRPRIVLGIIVLLAAVLASGSGPSFAKQYEIGSYAIDLQLTSTGDYVITERITYDFIEGTFTKANRQVPGKGFKELRFVSVDGIDHPVDTFNVKDGRSLSIDWTYPETSGQATFLIKYEAIGALRSVDGFNVIDWNPVGSDWTVPIRNVDVTITLPESVAHIEALPPEDLVGHAGTQRVQFHRDRLPPRTFYHVLLTFPEIIPVVEEPTPPIGRWILIGVAIGLLLMFLDLRPQLSQKPAVAATGPGPADLSPLDMAVLLFSDESQRRRGIVATIFSLAQRGAIRLAVQPKRTIFASDEVRAEIVSGSDLTGGEELIVAALQRHETLSRFARETNTFRTIIQRTRDELQARGLFSKEQQAKQVRTVLTGIPFLLLSGVSFALYAFHSQQLLLLTLGIVCLLQAVGRFIRGASITTLSPQGLYARQAVRSLLDKKMERLDDLMRYEMNDAWDELFAELPYLTLHEKFKATKIGQLKRQFRRMERVQAPAWIGYDTANVGKTIDALSAAESVNYTFLAIMVTAQSTGATGVSGTSGGGGVGAAGSGAGGGGGGAG